MSFATRIAQEFNNVRSHISGITAYHLLAGNLSVSNEVVTNGFSTTLYTGNGGTQSINTGIDMATQWGDDASEKFGGLVWLKSRSAATNNFLFDTVRGTTKEINTNTTEAEATLASSLTAFSSTGMTLGSAAGINVSAATYTSWNFQTTHIKTGTTNHGKAYTCHYNPFTGFTIIKYEGSGIAGHEIPHHLGRKLGFVTTKNLSAVENWYASNFDSIGAMSLNTIDKLGQIYRQVFSCTENSISTSTTSITNTSGHQHIMYGWANSYYDEADKLIGNYEVGVYQGTGAAGNKVTTRGKPAWIMVRILDAVGNWIINDNMRNAFDSRLYTDVSEAELTSATYSYHTILSDGFTIDHIHPGENAAGGQYLYMVVYDNDSGSGKSKYPRATDSSQLQLNTALVPFANGIDSNGAKNTIVYKNETITGLTYTAGKNYVYAKNDGTYGATRFEPQYNNFSSIGEVFNTSTNKWYSNTAIADGSTNQSTTNSIPVMTSDSYNGYIISVSSYYTTEYAGYKVFDILTNTGWLTNSVTTGWLSISLPKAKVINKYSLVNYGTFVTRMAKTWTLQASNTGTFSGEQVTLDTRTNIVWVDLVKQYFAFNNSTAYKYYRLVVTANNGDATYLNIGEMELIEAELTAAEITESRNYLDAIVHADANGQVAYVEELPKIEYKDIVKANEFQGKNACTAWVNFDGTTTPPTIRDSYNVSAVVRVTFGQFDVYFTEAMDNTNFTASYSLPNGVIPIVKSIAPTVNKVHIQAWSGGTYYNLAYNDVHIFGGKN